WSLPCRRSRSPTNRPPAAPLKGIRSHVNPRAIRNCLIARSARLPFSLGLLPPLIASPQLGGGAPPGGRARARPPGSAHRAGPLRRVRRAPLPLKADLNNRTAHGCIVPCVDGSELARRIFTSQGLVGAAMCSAFKRGSHDRWP